MNAARIAEALQAAVTRFPDHHDTPHLDAQVLLAHVLECNRSWLIAHAHDSLELSQQHHFQSLIDRRVAGEPVAYITGRREFWSLDLRVTPDVLIPRPDTEILVEAVIEHLRKLDTTKVTLVDLGTGSGAIALALASECPNACIIATDTSLKALQLARENAHRQQLEQLHFIASDWCAALHSARYQIICANPPYIAESDPHLGQGDVRFEPPCALRAGHDGLRDLAHIVDQARRCLTPHGYVFLEHGADQGAAVRQLFTVHGYQQIQSLRDLANHERVTLACHAV